MNGDAADLSSGLPPRFGEDVEMMLEHIDADEWEIRHVILAVPDVYKPRGWKDH